MLLKNRLFAILIFTLFFNLFSITIKAQLCTGSLGDPVVKITFGAGSNPGPPLPSSVTNVNYVSTDCPNDGNYTIRNNTTSCFGNSWHTLLSDHTGDVNGYMMVVNASFAPSDFYVQTIDGLCGNTTYEFASWILSLDKLANSIKVNITFSIEKTDGTVLQSYDTKDIDPTSTPQWKQYGFFFKTPSNITSVVIRMRNNAPGGNGNDLALDDITFRPCGPQLKSSIIESNSDSTTFCEGSSKNFTLQSVASPGYTSPVYQWQLSIDNGTTWKDIAGANTTTYIRNPTANGKYLYRLSVAESGNGSIASCRVVSNTVIINVVPNPTLQFSSATVCEGSNLTLNGVINYKSPLIGSFVITYPESNPSFVSKSQTDDPVTNSSTIVQVIHSTFKSAGKYILTAQNSSGCSASDSISILVNEKPVSRFSYDALTCEKSNINFKDQSTAKTAITNWNWKFGDGKTASAQNPTHSYDSAATYMVSLTTTDANGCVSDTVTKNIIVHALPQTDFILPKVCLADPFAQFINSTTISDKSESLFSYLWNFGDPSSGSNSSNIKDPQHVYKSTGSYNVSLRVTSSNNCIKDTFKIFTVNGSVPKAMFTVDNGNTICSADSVSLTNTSTVNFGSIVKVRIFWDNTNNPNISTTDDSPYVGKKYLFNYASLMSQQVQNFTIRYVVNSGINCVNETLQTITNNKTPTIKFDSLSNLCEEITPFSITGGSETSGAKGIGTYSGAGITGSDNFNPRAAGVGVHQIRYTFVTDAGCSAFKEQPITIYPQPSVSAGKSKTIIKGATIILHPTASGKGLSYLWSPSTFLDNVNDSTPKSMPLNDITYKLTVTSSDNCTNSDTINIKVINGLYVPNAFTPNNDGRNDVWRLPYLDEYPNTEVSIFNRFGDMIFHSIGSAVSWDGTYKGVQQPSGIYIYLIDLKTLPLIKGTIMLIR